MSMTLEQVSAMLRKRSPEVLWQQSEQMADAIDVHLTHITQPAQSVDVEKVREVIADLKGSTIGSSPFFVKQIDKLTAALQEKGNG